ncbi:hypothetical protein AVEN_94522-1 [Araneus ventricosus]|uniref:Uncharacterized protein n=1 Tax=Araneus ventricosus TaxID=182803 RepID=A0A4Y2FUU1_ARAVE|nr:hypothetical protein AVEN_94522-1 [Araneus ventricosus]
MRACETPEQYDAHVEQSRLGMSASRDIETPEVQRDPLEEDRHRRAASRANETTEEREACAKTVAKFVAKIRGPDVVAVGNLIVLPL